MFRLVPAASIWRLATCVALLCIAALPVAHSLITASVPNSEQDAASWKAFGDYSQGSGRCWSPSRYVLIDPPSTTMVWPVMKSLSPDAKKISAPSRSAGYPSR